MILSLSLIHIFLKAEALQEPQDDGGSQNDGAGTLDEGPAALPGSTEDIAPGGDVVCGQLHDKGSRVACKGLGLLQDDAGADDGSHADEVSGDSHQRRTAEYRTCDQADDGSTVGRAEPPVLDRNS